MASTSPAPGAFRQHFQTWECTKFSWLQSMTVVLAALPLNFFFSYILISILLFYCIHPQLSASINCYLIALLFSTMSCSRFFFCSQIQMKSALLAGVDLVACSNAPMNKNFVACRRRWESWSGTLYWLLHLYLPYSRKCMFVCLCLCLCVSVFSATSAATVLQPVPSMDFLQPKIREDGICWCS